MADSDSARLSVLLADVGDDGELPFTELVRKLAATIAAKGYGRVEMVRDETVARRFYVVRYWASAAAALACHRDADAQAVAARLSTYARLTHVLNGVRSRDLYPRPVADRRALFGTDRRTGFDRRGAAPTHAEPERRRTGERRLGPRRVQGRPVDVDLVSAARRARENAEAAFSQFKVGAALETADGAIITGCNVENATYGLTICAERVAMFKALSEGHRTFTRIAVVADTQSPTPPCGACRQILWEFGGDLEVLLANLQVETGRYRLAELLPLPFDARLL